MKLAAKNFKSSQKIWKSERVNVDMKIKLQNFVDNASTIQKQNITKCSLNLFIRN